MKKIKYDESEFVKQNIEAEDFLQNMHGQKYDIVILDLPEYASIPCNFPNVVKTYYKHNRNALELLNEEGILISTCCSHGFSRERFKKMLDDIVKDGKYKIIDDLNFDELDDHPIKANDNYSDYFKIYGIKKMS